MYQQHFIEQMKDYLSMNHFPYFVDGEVESFTRVVFDLEQQMVHVETLYQGDPSPFELGVSLAKLHHASARFPYIEEYTELVHNGKWPTIWYDDMQQIQKYYNHLHRYGTRSPFDERFLKDYTYFHQLAQVALFYLEDHQYEEFVRQHSDLCSLTYQHFSWADVERSGPHLYFANPKSWILDLGLRDLAEFIRISTMDRFDYHEVIPLLHGYQEVRELLPREFELMFARLLYPKDWVQLTLRYMHRKDDRHMDWENELGHIVEVQQGWEKVLAAFVPMVKEEFGVELAKVDWLVLKE